MSAQIANVIRVLEEFDGKLKRILNIGFRPNSDRTVATWCARHKRELVHLEVFEPNVKWIETTKGIGSVIHGDIRDIEAHCAPKSFDFVLWLHGPEHVSWQEFLALRPALEGVSRHGVIYQAPIGDRPQGNLYGNPYEQHREVLLPTMFEKLHYCVDLHNVGTEYCFSAIKVW